MADVLDIYDQDVVPGLATARKAHARIKRLTEWWGDMTLADVNRKNCQAFAADRGAGAARRELQDLQAAIGHHHREGLHAEVILVTLPPAGEARQRWLTRTEVAHLLRICLHTKEAQNGRDTRKHPLRHIGKYILFAAYTGSRPGDCLAASFRLGSQGGYVDIQSARYIRRPKGKVETKKRQPTTPIPDRLLAHLRRWERDGAKSVVEFSGRPVANIKTAWARLIELAGPAYADVVPYTLRHTAITWMKQRGVPSWEVGGYVGTSEAMIEKNYAHHDPHHLDGAMKAMGRK